MRPDRRRPTPGHDRGRGTPCPWRATGRGSARVEVGRRPEVRHAPLIVAEAQVDRGEDLVGHRLLRLELQGALEGPPGLGAAVERRPGAIPATASASPAPGPRSSIGPTARRASWALPASRYFFPRATAIPVGRPARTGPGEPEQDDGHHQQDEHAPAEEARNKPAAPDSRRGRREHLGWAAIHDSVNRHPGSMRPRRGGGGLGRAASTLPTSRRTLFNRNPRRRLPPDPGNRAARSPACSCCS